jgi:hypothetical protein
VSALARDLQLQQVEQEREVNDRLALFCKYVDCLLSRNTARYLGLNKRLQPSAAKCPRTTCRAAWAAARAIPVPQRAVASAAAPCFALHSFTHALGTCSCTLRTCTQHSPVLHHQCRHLQASSATAAAVPSATLPGAHTHTRTLVKLKSKTFHS